MRSWVNESTVVIAQFTVHRALKMIARKSVPFVANHEDRMHCSQAAFRMLFKYLFDEDLTWEEIDKITKTIPGKASWTMAAHIALAERGVEVINIEPFDYQRFHDEGVDYLKNNFGEETAKYYLEKSNLLSVKDDIPKFLAIVHHETRRATAEDIVKFLKEGFLLGAEINSRILNKGEGFSLHYVLITDHEDGFLVIHDPGPPPLKNRRVPKDEFLKAFAFEGANGEVTAFRLEQR